LFATDYSDSSKCALPVAAALAHDAGGSLLIAHVSEREEYPVGELFDEEATSAPQDIEQLYAVKPLRNDVPFTHQLLYGNPAGAILSLAKTENVSAIVIGSHGQTGLLDLVAGRVAEDVARAATCQVVVVRTPDEK